MKAKTVLKVFLYTVTFKWLFTGLIYIYKKLISPLMPHVCIYKPTCSTYMLTAINRFGVLKGIAMGTKRIIRCNPFNEGGVDPVPYNVKGDMKWLM